MKKICVVIGTRPEAIKMAPVVLALRARPKDFEVTICSTGQHTTMLDGAMAAFGLKADFELRVMKPGQSLAELTARLLLSLDVHFEVPEQSSGRSRVADAVGVETKLAERVSQCGAASVREIPPCGVPGACTGAAREHGGAEARTFLFTETDDFQSVRQRFPVWQVQYIKAVVEKCDFLLEIQRGSAVVSDEYGQPGVRAGSACDGYRFR